MASDGKALVDSLELKLGVLNEAALRTIEPADTTVLENELPRLQAWTTSGTGVESPEDDRVTAAVREYRESGTLHGLSQARLVCYGCTRVVDSHKLIEEAPRFTGLLEYVDRFAHYPRPFRRCYRGLLNAFFSYDPERGSDEGPQSWQLLRHFLERKKSAIESPGSDPAWVTALLENRNLLTEDPVARYGMAALKENYAAFQGVLSRLGIDEDSWLVRRLVLAQVEAALGLPDQHFKSVIVRLLAELAKHPLILEQGLARLVDRFAASSSHDVHSRLRDFAVKQWGDPRAAANAPRWARVRPTSREMAASWLP